MIERSSRSLPVTLFGAMTLLLLLAGVVGCRSGAAPLPSAAPATPHLVEIIPTITMPQAPPTITPHLSSITSNPTHATVLEREKSLLYLRLDPDGIYTGQPLQQAEPLFSADELGALEAFAYEHRDPFLSLSFYIFESYEAKQEGLHYYLAEASGTLPPNTEVGTVGTGLLFMIGYYYTDDSRGDSRQADAMLGEIGTRVHGLE